MHTPETHTSAPPALFPAFLRIASVCVVALLTWTVATSAGANQALGQSIEEQLAAKAEVFETAYNSGNIDDLMALFTPDASLAPGGEQTFTDPAQVRGILLDSIQSTDNLSLSIRETTTGDGTAKQTGRYVVDNGSEFGLSGGFTLSWVQTDSGDWLVSNLAWTQ